MKTKFIWFGGVNVSVFVGKFESSYHMNPKSQIDIMYLFDLSHQMNSWWNIEQWTMDCKINIIFFSKTLTSYSTSGKKFCHQQNANCTCQKRNWISQIKIGVIFPTFLTKLIQIHGFEEKSTFQSKIQTLNTCIEYEITFLIRSHSRSRWNLWIIPVITKSICVLRWNIIFYFYFWNPNKEIIGSYSIQLGIHAPLRKT